jgi:hypothetical protein
MRRSRRFFGLIFLIAASCSKPYNHAVESNKSEWLPVVLLIMHPGDRSLQYAWTVRGYPLLLIPADAGVADKLDKIYNGTNSDGLCFAKAYKARIRVSTKRFPDATPSSPRFHARRIYDVAILGLSEENPSKLRIMLREVHLAGEGICAASVTNPGIARPIGDKDASEE